jgi:hypothetical protein
LEYLGFFILNSKGGYILFAKAVLRGGHVGKGKCYEMTRYLVVDNIVDVLHVARNMPRVKKNHLAIISCERIGKEEYLEGKLSESRDPYLGTFKNKNLGGGKPYGRKLHGNIA